MKPVAPGTVIFHRYRGYGVVTSVNLMTGWISARFGDEGRTLDLNLSCDQVQDADGNLCIQDILMDFRKDAVQLRKLYNISLSEIKSLGKIKHQIKYEM